MTLPWNRRDLLSFALAATAGGPAVAAPAFAPQAADPAQRLRDLALADRGVKRTLTGLTRLGPRVAGSKGFLTALDWSERTMAQAGLTDVHREWFPVDLWIRGEQVAEIVAPERRPLVLTQLPTSGPTPPGGLEAEAVVFPTYAAFHAAEASAVADRIVVVTEVMARTRDGRDYGRLYDMRGEGPGLAAQKGAAAYLLRSLATGPLRVAHTGDTDFPDGVKPIPCAALASQDAHDIARLAQAGPVRIRLIFGSRYQKTRSANLIGELKGESDEVVLAGAHLDSWDLSEAAIDDGAGVAIVLSAARLLKASGLPLKRSIRFILFGDEETGGSGPDFARRHAADIPRFSAALEADFGAGAVYEVALPKAASDPFRARLDGVIQPLGAKVAATPSRGGGEDFRPLQAKGVPMVGVRQDGSTYFDVHHSSADTIDRVDWESFQQLLAVWTPLLWLLANDADGFRS